MERLYILPLLVFSLLFLISESQANVLVDDADSNAMSNNAAIGPTSDVVPTGSGMAGDYQLIGCAITSFIGNTFNDPTPGTWTELDQGPCGDLGNNSECSHGIWGRFSNNTSSEDITCSWTNATNVFAAGSFRYNDVDPDDPIIAVECDSGFGFGEGVLATAPSVETVAGSQVARIFTYTNFNDTGTSHSNFNTDIFGTYTSVATSTEFEVNVFHFAQTNLVLVDGPTGPVSVDTGLDSEWRACTVALRMAPVIRNIPTISEWGFFAVAVFMGAAGVWYLRRRQTA